MKSIRLLALVFALLAPPAAFAQRSAAADRAWGPFFRAFREAVRRRDADTLKGMMARDFHYHSSGGDENGDGDTREEAFEFWAEPRVRAWESLDKILAQGTVRNTAMREPGNTRPGRVAPPVANSRRAIQNASFEWYALFEYMDGRWYLTAFSPCCE